MKRRLVVGVALGALLLYLSLRQVNLGDTWDTLKEARYGFFFAMIALNLVILWIRAVRWRILLLPIRSIPSHRLLSPMCIGFMANFIFPARAGEFVRAYMVGRKEQVSKSSAFATVVVERLFDGLAVISFLGLAPFFLHGVEGGAARKIQWIGLGAFLVYIVILAVLLVLSHHRKALARFLMNSAAAQRWKIVKKAFEMVQKFTDGLAILKSTGEVFAALALSLTVWGLAAVINLLMMRSVGLHLPLYAAFFLVVIQVFGVMVPSPGFLGAYQAAHIFALAFYGVDSSVAFSLSILIHAGFFFTFVGLGLFFLGREQLSLQELGKATAEKT